MYSMQSRDEQAFHMNPLHVDDPLYTADEMAIIIEYKKQKMFKKGTLTNLTCFVLRNNEFKDFINLLKKNKALLPNGTRLQFVYEFDGHWLSGDVWVNEY